MLWLEIEKYTVFILYISKSERNSHNVGEPIGIATSVFIDRISDSVRLLQLTRDGGVINRSSVVCIFRHRSVFVADENLA